MPKSLEELQVIAKRVRREIVEMIGTAGSGHPGGSLSAVEIVVELYFNTMRIDPKNPKWPQRDRFILSKGHAAPVLYAVMAEAGYADTPLDQLNTLRKMGSMYQGHPDMRFIPSLEASTGSLGEGLSLAIGMGIAARLDGSPSRTYCMLGDGESQEGQIWEAAMAGRSTSWITSAALSITTASSSMASSRTSWMSLRSPKNGAPSAGTSSRWTATIPAAVRAAFEEAAATKGKPTCLVAHTIKGKGVSFMENNPKFHGTAPTPAEVKLALQELQ